MDKLNKVEMRLRKKVEKSIRKEERKRFRQELLLSNMISTTKLIMWVLIINGILWIWCSYILAFMDKPQIAEALSSNVCTVIIGQIVSYFISKTIENVFKFNNIGGPATATPISAQPITTNKEETINEPADNTSDENYAGDSQTGAAVQSTNFNSASLD